MQLNPGVSCTRRATVAPLLSDLALAILHWLMHTFLYASYATSDNSVMYGREKDAEATKGRHDPDGKNIISEKYSCFTHIYIFTRH